MAVGGKAAATSTQNREAVLQAARVERQQREHQRRQHAATTSVQSMWRSHSARGKLRMAEIPAWDTKVATMKMVGATLRAKGVPFVAPLKAQIELSRTFAFCASPNDTDDGKRLQAMVDMLLSSCAQGSAATSSFLALACTPATTAQFVVLAGLLLEHGVALYSRQLEQGVANLNESLLSGASSPAHVFASVARLADVLTEPSQWNVLGATGGAHPAAVVAATVAGRVVGSRASRALLSAVLHHCLTTSWSSGAGASIGSSSKADIYASSPIVSMLIRLSHRALGVFDHQPGDLSASGGASGPAAAAVSGSISDVRITSANMAAVATVWSSHILTLPSVTRSNAFGGARSKANLVRSPQFLHVLDAIRLSAEGYIPTLRSPLHSPTTAFAPAPSAWSASGLSSSSSASSGGANVSAGQPAPTPFAGGGRVAHAPMHPVLAAIALGNIADLVSCAGTLPSLHAIAYVRCVNALLNRAPSVLFALRSVSGGPAPASASSTPMPSPAAADDGDVIILDDDAEYAAGSDAQDAIDAAAEKDVHLALSLARKRHLSSIARALESGSDLASIQRDTAPSGTTSSSASSSSASNMPAFASITAIGLGSAAGAASGNPGIYSGPFGSSSSSAAATGFNSAKRQHIGSPSGGAGAAGHTRATGADKLSRLLSEHQFAILSDSTMHDQLSRLAAPSRVRRLVSVLLPLVAARASNTAAAGSVPLASSPLPASSESSAALFSMLYALHQRLSLAHCLAVSTPSPASGGRPSVRVIGTGSGSLAAQSLDAGPSASLLRSLVVDSSSSTDATAPSSALHRMWCAIQSHPCFPRLTLFDATSTVLDVPDLAAAVTLFMHALAHALVAVDDVEFLGGGGSHSGVFGVVIKGGCADDCKPLPRRVIREVLLFTRTLLYRLCWSDKSASDTPLPRRPTPVLELMSHCILAFNALYDRHSRLAAQSGGRASEASSSSSSSSSYGSEGLLQPAATAGSPWRDEDFQWPAIPDSEITPEVILGIESAVVTDESMSGVVGHGAAAPSSSDAAAAAAAAAADGGASSVPQSSGLRRIRAARLQFALTAMPQVVPFKTRVELFTALRTRDKELHTRDEFNVQAMMAGAEQDRVKFQVRRGSVVEDAQAAFAGVIARNHGSGDRLKERFYISFINAEGMPEAGIDGGGLMKEFVDSVVKDAFLPDRGLFTSTADHFVYPDASSLAAPGLIAPAASGISVDAFGKAIYVYDSGSVSAVLRWYEFLGQVLGKAVYEGILVEPRFAGFVLRKLLGRANTVDDLGSYDPQLYRMLMQLKRMVPASAAENGLFDGVPDGRGADNGDDDEAMDVDVEDAASSSAVEERNNSASAGSTAPPGSSAAAGPSSQAPDPIEDLGLTFSVSDEIPALGSTRAVGGVVTHKLVPNGDHTAVTSHNLRLYISLLADFRLNKQIAPHVRAFLRGFRQLIPLSWMRMFGPRELQVLLGGASDAAVDLADLRRNTTYSGFDSDHPYVNTFWKVVASFSGEEVRKLLTFVTSVSRPPLLGFGSLNPRFGIVRVNIAKDDEKLPVAATCFNVLKLPVYTSESVLREKLLYAINSGAGFELT